VCGYPAVAKKPLLALVRVVGIAYFYSGAVYHRHFKVARSCLLLLSPLHVRQFMKKEQLKCKRRQEQYSRGRYRIEVGLLYRAQKIALVAVETAAAAMNKKQGASGIYA
jgi:hypothetical protein